MMHSSCPSWTVSPCLTSTFHMLPCSGDGSVSGPPPPIDRDFWSLRRGGLRAAAAALDLEALAGSSHGVGLLDALGSSLVLYRRRGLERERLQPFAVLQQIPA